MKKIILAIAAAVAVSASASAQEFFPYWYGAVKGGAQYTVGEGPFTKLLSPNVAGEIGYQFTPVFGLRADVSGWSTKGYMPRVNEAYKATYVQPALDATINVLDIFTAKDRLVEPYVFAGVGLFAGLNNDEINKLVAKNPENVNAPLAWDGTLLSPAARLGAGFDVNITKKLALNLEFVSNFESDKMNSKKGTTFGADRNDVDYNFAALAGLKFYLGSPAAKRAAAAAAAEAAAAQAAAEKAAAERAAAEKAAAEKAAAEKAAAEKAAREAAERAAAEKAAAERAAKEAYDRLSPDQKERLFLEQEAQNALCYENVLFTINSFSLTKTERAKVNELIACLKANPTAKAMIYAYADRGTGKPATNMKLTERRAKTVADALVAAGIDKARIFTVAKGDTVNPFETPEENRVDVCIVK